MLHIGESVPPLESVLSNSGNSDLLQPTRLIRQRSSSIQFRSIPEFRQTPEFRLALTLMLICVVKHNYLKQASNSGTEFRELGGSGIRRNS
jgi:hypothetical protein